MVQSNPIEHSVRLLQKLLPSYCQGIAKLLSSYSNLLPSCCEVIAKFFCCKFIANLSTNLLSSYYWCIVKFCYDFAKLVSYYCQGVIAKLLQVYIHWQVIAKLLSMYIYHKQGELIIKLGEIKIILDFMYSAVLYCVASVNSQIKTDW